MASVGEGLTRVEFIMREDDYELLRRVVRSRSSSLSETIRQALYAQIEPLKRAKEERDARTYREVEERRKLKEWESYSKTE